MGGKSNVEHCVFLSYTALSYLTEIKMISGKKYKSWSRDMNNVSLVMDGV